MIPKRRKPVKSGIVRNEERIRSTAHLKFVRGFDCSAAGKHPFEYCGGKVQAAHVQDDDRVPVAERGCLSEKPGDNWTYPLCARHHDLAHNKGHDRLDRECGIDRVKIAEAIWRMSPARIRYESRVQQSQEQRGE